MALAHSSTTAEPVWTPRQREVLALLVRGRTNGQIAEELGISLDGAKWHVSEIITKLGVESREDAAEYWRARNGLRPRFTRLLKSLIPGPIWAKVAGVSAVIAAAGIAAAAITIWAEEGDDARSAADTPPTAVASVATSDPGAAPTSTTPGPEVIDGVTVRPLTLADQARTT